jgi:SsrA-binding protein
MEKKPLVLIASNKKARYDYHLLDNFEAGLVLQGSEVKSLRGGNASLLEAFVQLDQHGEAWLFRSHIPQYTQANRNNHEPRRPRKLLLHQRELLKLRRAIQEKGMTIMPVRLYFKGSLVKLEIAIAKGKKQHDKRQTLKERDAKRQIREHE